RLALLQEAGLVDDQHRVLGGQRFQRVLAHDVAQPIRLPPPAAQDCLLPPWTGIAPASARIQPVLRGSLPKSPSTNCPADSPTRCWLNSGPIRAFSSRSDDAHSSKVVSTDAPAIYDLPNHAGLWIQKFEQNATVMLELEPVYKVVKRLSMRVQEAK